jgi:protein involved in polysaccharide export with SLBB domain
MLVVLTSACVHAPEVTLRAESPEPSGPYLIKPGDTLSVRFYKTPELNVDTPVRSDGKISLELVGDVLAAGMQPADLSQLLNQRYKGELQDPRVTVMVTAFGGEVYVSGEVKAPAAVSLAVPLTAMQAIVKAGGFLATGEKTSVILIRNEHGTWHGYKLDLDRASSGEDLDADPLLQPRDIVHVPRSVVANVNNFVDLYIRKNIPVTSIPVGAF